MFFKFSNPLARVLSSKIFWGIMVVAFAFLMYAGIRNMIALNKLRGNVNAALQKTSDLNRDSASTREKINILNQFGSNESTIKESLGYVKQGEHLVIFKSDKKPQLASSLIKQSGMTSRFYALLKYLKNIFK